MLPEWLVPLRDHDGYEELKRQAEQRQSQARDAFNRAGGPSLLLLIERTSLYEKWWLDDSGSSLKAYYLEVL